MNQEKLTLNEMLEKLVEIQAETGRIFKAPNFKKAAAGMYYSETGDYSLQKGTGVYGGTVWRIYQEGDFITAGGSKLEAEQLLLVHLHKDEILKGCIEN